MVSQLTRRAGLYPDPSWSPDGTRLVFGEASKFVVAGIDRAGGLVRVHTPGGSTHDDVDASPY